MEEPVLKKARFLLPLFLPFIIPMTAQVEHAPTPEQCRADADIWGVLKATVLTPNDYQFRNLTRAVGHDQAISAKKLDVRIDELSKCMITDRVQSFRYEQGSRAYNSTWRGVAGALRIKSMISMGSSSIFSESRL
jgi:hypothetical protein